VSFLALVVVAAATADDRPKLRQYYSSWRKHSEKPYYYRYYYYKPSADAEQYRYHYAIYYPSRGKKVYMYNPEKKRFWGYYDLEAKGYSLLPVEARRERLDDIPEEAFPKLGKMPPIPESRDNEAMLEPPGELPKSKDRP
jgi:hypothetical protein